MAKYFFMGRGGSGVAQIRVYFIYNFIYNYIQYTFYSAIFSSAEKKTQKIAKNLGSC